LDFLKFLCAIAFSRPMSVPWARTKRVATAHSL